MRRGSIIGKIVTRLMLELEPKVFIFKISREKIDETLNDIYNKEYVWLVCGKVDGDLQTMEHFTGRKKQNAS